MFWAILWPISIPVTFYLFIIAAAAAIPHFSLFPLFRLFPSTVTHQYCHTKAIFEIIFTMFLSRAEVMVDGGGGGLWKRRAGREGKAPQMKILNQYALPLQLRPRRGLHLIYSPKPGNRAIKRNQTIRFPVLNGPTAWCGQPRIQLNSFELASKRQRQRPSQINSSPDTLELQAQRPLKLSKDL